MPFNLTKKELYLAFFVALMGFFLYSRSMVLWLDKLTIFQGWLFYNVLWFIIIYVGSRQGFFIYEPKKVPLTQAIGLYLITTAVLMTVNWESGYVQLMTRGNQDMSTVYVQTDDGMSWFYITTYVPGVDVNDCLTNDNCTARILFIVAIPFILALIGGFLLTGRVHL